ncbi:hypothetical protein MIR68_000483 [Amoeboaphelidium protococcarum]|nr:hypothetical protein MIR68_000483 [Amoeboaphelidium protococcarum]
MMAESVKDTATGSKIRSRKPANTAFKQQRLKAWQPILTPRTVLPTFFIIGLIFVPLGAGLYVTSNSVQELSFDYTDCINAPSTFTAVSDKSPITAWRYNSATSTCSIQFNVDSTFKAPVFLYYRLTNFYQNHRNYVKSVDATQLKGSADTSSISTNCAPLDKASNDVFYYPCGLIANSLFNDTIGTPVAGADSFRISQASNPSETYTFSEKGISWPSDQSKYALTSIPLDKIAPPRNWVNRRIGGKSLNGSTWAAVVGSTDPSQMIFNPQTDEHFQVWMRTAGLPTFRKLYGKNTADDLQPGSYQIDIEYNFPTSYFSGTKGIVLSTTSWLGGKNPFLGVAYMVVGCICLFLGIIFLIKQYVSPRKLGDHSYLSWNQHANASTTQQQSGAGATDAANGEKSK